MERAARPATVARMTRVRRCWRRRMVEAMRQAIDSGEWRGGRGSGYAWSRTSPTTVVRGVWRPASKARDTVAPPSRAAAVTAAIAVV